MLQQLEADMCHARSVVTLALISLNIPPTQPGLQSRLEPACSRPHPSRCTLLALSAAVAQRLPFANPPPRPLHYNYYSPPRLNARAFCHPTPTFYFYMGQL